MLLLIILAFFYGCATVVSKMINYRAAKVLGTWNGSLVNYVVASILALILLLFSPYLWSDLQACIKVPVYLYAGGVGTISGSILGAVALTILPELLRFLADWRLVIYALLLLYIIIWKPYGLFGGREFRFLGLETIAATESRFGKWLRQRVKGSGKKVES